LIAVIAVVTVIGLTAALEGTARWLAPWRAVNRCQLADGSARAGCVSAPIKFWEGPWMTYAYNACGYRTREPCAAPPPGVRRVAVLGTSIAYGWYVPYEDTFAARASEALKAACGRPVEFQNLSEPSAGVDKPLWHHVQDQFRAALALHPDAIITILSSSDLSLYQGPISGPPSPPPPIRAASTSGWTAQWRAFSEKIATRSIALMALRTFTFRNSAVYMQNYLASPNASFLEPTLDARWRMRVGVAESVLGPLEARARAAGIPFIVFYFPNYGQAIAAASPELNRTLGPYALQTSIRQIVERHGGIFVDLTPSIARTRDLYQDYFISLDHPDGAGHGLIARGVVSGLEAAAPAFAACRAKAS
jgi:hypothetical protein